MNIKEAIEVAQDETTSPEKLRELANLHDSAVLKKLVVNPNIPPDVFKKLASLFPRQVFNNPAIDLLLLEITDLLSDALMANVMCTLLKERVAMNMIEYVANSTDNRLKLAILMNPLTPQYIVEQLAESKNVEISEAAKTHINYSRYIKDNYQQFAQKKIDKILEASDKQMEFEIAFNKVRRYPDFFKGIYEQTGMARDTFCRKNAEALAKRNNSTTPSQPLLLSDEEVNNLYTTISSQYIVKNSSYIRQIAANPDTPTAMLEKIADFDKYGATHFDLAGNPNVSTHIINKILDKLAVNINKFTPYAEQKRNYRITYCKIISNPATSPEILKTLVNHQDSKIRIIAANCDAMPKHLVEEILLSLENEDLDLNLIPYEYKNLLKNSFLSGALIDKFISYWESKEKLVKNHNSFRSGAPIWIKEVFALTKHPHINCSTLKTLLKHEDKSIRNSAFSNMKIPQCIVNEWNLSFLNDLSSGQLNIIAKNMYTPEIILEKIAKNKQDFFYTTNALLSNPCVPDKIAKTLEKSPLYNPRILMSIRSKKQGFLDIWKSSLSDCNRLTLLQDSRTPVPLLVKIAGSTFWLERYIIAQNPRTPDPIIQRLAEDGNRIVRAAARNRLKII